MPIEPVNPEAEYRRFVVGVSGASGAAYSLRLLELLLGMGHEVHLVVSDYGRRLLFEESGVASLDLESLAPRLAAGEQRGACESRLIVHPNKDVGAVIASGSFLHDGMVVLPCSSASVPVLACRFPCAGVPRMRSRSVSSRPSKRYTGSQFPTRLPTTPNTASRP